MHGARRGEGGFWRRESLSWHLTYTDQSFILLRSRGLRGDAVEKVSRHEKRPIMSKLRRLSASRTFHLK